MMQNWWLISLRYHSTRQTTAEQ